MTLTCGQARSGMCWQAAALGRVVHLPAGNIISQHNNRPVATAPAGRRAAPSPSPAGPGCLMPAGLPASLYDPLPLAPVRVPDIASASRRSGAECGLAGASFSF